MSRNRRPRRSLSTTRKGTEMSKLTEVVLTVAGVALFAIMGAVIMIEWFAGCGETYVDAYGKRHQYECVFIKQ